jgi:hypothetical protein
MLRRVHPDAANLFHGRSPLSEINNDLILAHSMPPGAVHTNNLQAVPPISPMVARWSTRRKWLHMRVRGPQSSTIGRKNG